MTAFETIPPPDAEYLDIACDPRPFVLGFTSSEDHTHLREWSASLAKSGLCRLSNEDLELLRWAISLRTVISRAIWDYPSEMWFSEEVA